MPPSDRVYPTTIAPLTSLRFFAAAAIFAYHTHLFLPVPKVPATLLLYKGYLGIDFFFILSGFILTHVYLPRWRDGDFSRRRFIVNRLARIYPMHLLTLLIAAAIGILKVQGWEQATTLRDFLAHVLLLQAWGDAKIFSFNLPAWSISAEWFAYLLFPFLLPCFVKARQLSMVLLSLWLYGGMVLIVYGYFGHDITGLSANFGILRILPEFCLGMALYLLSLNHPWRYSPGWSTIGCLLLFTAALYGGLPDFVAIVFLALLIYAAAGNSLNGRTMLSLPVLVYLGEISYAIYMVHFLMEFGAWKLAMAYGGQAFFIAASFPATIMLAAASHHAVEIPARRALRRLGGG